MTFGIPRYAFPLTANGDMSSEYHKYWLKGRRQKEKAEEEKDQCDSSNATNVIIMPSRLDVILGRGKRSQQHVGNLRLNFRLEQSLELYNQLDNVGKLVIIMEMISFVKKDGGRFLKLSPDGVHWEVVSDDLVRQKLGHDYRTIRKRIARLSNTNNKVVETKASKRARPDRGD